MLAEVWLAVVAGTAGGSGGVVGKLAGDEARSPALKVFLYSVMVLVSCPCQVPKDLLYPAYG